MADSQNTRRRALLILALLFLLTSVLLPVDWYNPLPQYEKLDPPVVSGLFLLRLSFALEGVLLLVLAVTRWRFSALPASQLVLSGFAVETKLPRWEGLSLLAITLLGVALRLYRLDSTLWLDEITPRLDYAEASYLQVATSFSHTNNHLLYTLLTKVSVGLFGEHEWAIRLPAALFGIATVPAIYWVARHVMSGLLSLGCALLLATSYHHVFFSQNARGYAVYLLLSLLASALLARALGQDRPLVWCLYVAIMVANLSVFMISGFVIVAHGMVALAVVLSKRLRGVSPYPVFRRLSMVFSAILLLGFHLYAIVLPTMYAFMKAVYTDPSAGYLPFSLEFLREVIRGITAGYGPGFGVAVIPLFLLVITGYVDLLGRSWVFVLSLTLPAVVHATFLLVLGLVFSPRFFLLILLVAILAAVHGVNLALHRLTILLGMAPRVSDWCTVAAIVAVAVLSLASLPTYYRTPKQPYLQVLHYVESTRGPEDVVVVIHVASSGFRYYTKRLGIGGYHYLRSVEALDEILEANAGHRVVLITTFHRALRLSLPELNAKVRQGWRRLKVFPATIGDGSITVWEPRPT